MDRALVIPRFSIGIGDRFAQQGRAQLQAFVEARNHGATVAPVWNKSFREHTIIGSQPSSVRQEADAAVGALGWTSPYFVDADHISLKTVDGFLGASDFYTIDVADFIGKPSPTEEVQAFAARRTPAGGRFVVPGIDRPFLVTRTQVETIADKYLLAIREAGKLYRHIVQAKGQGTFVTEISMDETDLPQTPLDLWFILAAVAEEGIPLQTIAPKFSGRFNKGVDFVGNLGVFDQEFQDDLAVIAFAVQEFGLPASLKLSVHSGSDKFSLYPLIRRALAKTGAGLHLKTAGTTWLEEVAGIAQAGGDGLDLAKEIYSQALGRFDELAAPYATVIDIRRDQLPSAAEVGRWTAGQFVGALAHDQSHPGFNPSLRQLIHVGYKVAAEQGSRFKTALDQAQTAVSSRVTANLWERHLRPLFVGEP